MKEEPMIDMRVLSPDLKLAEDGIWYSLDKIEDISYPSDGNDVYFPVEDNSFWFRHRNECITSIVQCFSPKDNQAIFDIGGGNGFVSLGLIQAGFDVVLMEPGISGVINARKRGIENIICATTKTANLANCSLSAVGLFDVIEHVEADLTFLKSIRMLMKENAYLYVTVPAYSFLWSMEDVLVGHFRRYNLNSICSVLRAAGFNIEFSSYIFRPLPPLIFCLRTIPHQLGLSRLDHTSKNVSRDHGLNQSMIQRIASCLLRQEVNSLRNQQPIDFGSSCLIVAKAA
ncbi:MAG: methyltransferase domain-containing protein [Pseudanabaena sp. ELA607]|jgi:SAM-dependent methyltransferase